MKELKGLKISIYGDSISTFEGYSNTLNKDNMVYFPIKGLVKDVNDTWWKIFIDNNEIELVVNNSSSGCYVHGVGNNSGSTYDEGIGKRLDYLHIGNNYPDAIIIYMGINDLGHRIESGYDIDYKFGKCNKKDIKTFIDAYDYMIRKIISKYPKAKLFLMNYQYLSFDSNKDLKDEYNNIIKMIANNYKCNLIDIASSSISGDQYRHFSSDNLHPNNDGMKVIAECVEKKFLEVYSK